MLSFYFFPSDLESFGDEENISFKRTLQIFEIIKIKSKYLDSSNCVFTINSFKYTNRQISVFWLDICIFTPVQTQEKFKEIILASSKLYMFKHCLFVNLDKDTDKNTMRRLDFVNKYIHIITFLGHTVCRARFHILVDGSNVEI